MELKSLKRLEEICVGYTCDGYYKIARSEIESILLSISSEVAYRFIELPTCADGVIKIGDVIRNDFCRIGPIDAILFTDDGGWEVFHDGNSWAVLGEERHTDELDDLLFSYGQECIRASDEADNDSAKRAMLLDLRKQYAIDIRKQVWKECQ